MDSQGMVTRVEQSLGFIREERQRKRESHGIDDYILDTLYSEQAKKRIAMHERCM